MILIYSRWVCTKCKSLFFCLFIWNWLQTRSYYERHTPKSRRIKDALLACSMPFNTQKLNLSISFHKIIDVCCNHYFCSTTNITWCVGRKTNTLFLFFHIVNLIRDQLKEKQSHGLSCKYSTMNWCPNYETTYQSNTFECLCWLIQLFEERASSDRTRGAR